MPGNLKIIKSILEDKRNGAERRHDALIASEQFEPLKADVVKQIDTTQLSDFF